MRCNHSPIDFTLTSPLHSSTRNSLLHSTLPVSDSFKAMSSDSEHDGDRPMRNRSRSTSRRSRTRSPPPLESAHAAHVAAAAQAVSSAANDGDWDSDAEHADLDDADPSGADLADGAGVGQFLRAIFQRMQGGNGNGAPTAASLEAVLAGLAEQGLVTQDADGNLVLAGGDEDDEGAEDDGLLEGETDESEGEMGEEEEDEEEQEEEHAASHIGRGVAIRAQRARGGAGAARAGSASPEEPVPKDVAALAEYAAYNRITPSLYPRNVLQSLHSFQRDSPAAGLGATSPAHRAFVSSRHVPQTCSAIEQFEGRAFCGKFSSPSNGAPSRFACATQDGVVHLYDTATWRLYKDIQARSVGWSIVDVDFSTDSRFVIYSSWSNSVQLINTEGAFELHESLDFDPPGQSHVCMFGIRFSTNNSREILAGLNNGFAILYDVERKRKIWSARAHADDINSVCWLDNSGDLFATGSDDASIRIWDRRLLANVDNAEGKGAVPSVAAASARRAAKPVGGFLGHMHGLTCVASLPDGNARYMLSNSKDQSMKLWDLRRANNATAVVAATEERAAHRQMMDYRCQEHKRAQARPVDAWRMTLTSPVLPVVICLFRATCESTRHPCFLLILCRRLLPFRLELH